MSPQVVLSPPINLRLRINRSLRKFTTPRNILSLHPRSYPCTVSNTSRTNNIGRLWNSNQPPQFLRNSSAPPEHSGGLRRIPARPYGVLSHHTATWLFYHAVQRLLFYCSYCSYYFLVLTSLLLFYCFSRLLGFSFIVASTRSITYPLYILQLASQYLIS